MSPFGCRIHERKPDSARRPARGSPCRLEVDSYYYLRSRSRSSVRLLYTIGYRIPMKILFCLTTVIVGEDEECVVPQPVLFQRFRDVVDRQVKVSSHGANSPTQFIRNGRKHIVKLYKYIISVHISIHNSNGISDCDYLQGLAAASESLGKPNTRIKAARWAFRTCCRTAR